MISVANDAPELEARVMTPAKAVGGKNNKTVPVI